MRIIFMGTPDFAVPSLDMLVSEGHEIAAVVTQPDKPKGRGNKLAAPPVKEYAQKAGIMVLQPERIRTAEFLEQVRELAPDLLVTAAYGKIISKDVLDLPRYGCINVHGSLLPKYRGAGPIHRAIIDGERVTGITTMFTDAGMDTGDMLLKKEIEITGEMTTGELHDKMAVLGAEVLRETLSELEKGTLKRVPQDDGEATYAPMIKKEDGRIDWSKASADIHNLVRGTDPWPGAYTVYKSERMRVWKTEVLDNEKNVSTPGTILKVTGEGIVAATGSGLIRIKEVQFDSGKRMSVESYLAGHKIDEGEVLGG